MAQSSQYTIAAQATPAGRGGVGIIRVSGDAAKYIAEQVLGHCPAPRYAEYLNFKDAHGQVIDQGLALYFPKPHSFTGEDVLELQGHGGPVVMDLLLRAVINAGARLARPGEFSERAFLNNKLDLAQAEAIADLIDAGSEQAARSALRSLQGDFSKAVHQLVTDVTQLRIYTEAAIDFPEEEVDFLAEGQVQQQITQLQQTLGNILNQAQQGSLMREGINLVLVGQPNVGKSSLLNALAKRDAAIVTDIPGTTRDVVREVISLDGLPVHILDTAGLRETQDQVEQEGMRRTWQAIDQADVVLCLLDDSSPEDVTLQTVLAQLPRQVGVVLVYNKCDLSGRPVGSIETDSEYLQINISAKTGEGIPQLVQSIKQLAGMQAAGEGAFMARQRHLSALNEAHDHLQQADAQAQAKQGELVAEELKQVQQALGTITGEVTSDDLLGEIFSHFCIGK